MRRSLSAVVSVDASPAVSPTMMADAPALIWRSQERGESVEIELGILFERWSEGSAM
jgi:hypothetical protein